MAVYADDGVVRDSSGYEDGQHHKGNGQEWQSLAVEGILIRHVVEPDLTRDNVESDEGNAANGSRYTYPR